MKTAKSSGVVFDSVVLREVTLEAHLEILEANFAQVDSKSDVSYGKLTLRGMEHFRDTTQEAIRRAIAAMEEDALQLLFPNNTRTEEAHGEEGSLGDTEDAEEGSQL